MEDAMQILSAN
jgi:hypothetical protein